jgi:single-strand DNA-binding protein
LQVRDYTDQNGNKRRAVGVIAQSVYFGDSKKDADSTAQTTEAQQTTAGAVNDGFTEIEGDDSDLPF